MNLKQNLSKNFVNYNKNTPQIWTTSFLKKRFLYYQSTSQDFLPAVLSKIQILIDIHSIKFSNKG